MRPILFSLILLMSCNTSRTSLFSKKSPHENYEARLADAKLGNTAFVRLWNAAAATAIQHPLKVDLPYKETGYFSPERPAAAGFTFSAKRGQRVSITVEVTPTRNALWFTDLWENSDGKLKPVISSDSSQRTVYHDIGKDGFYVLRFQPELLVGLGYTLTVTTSASLAFPVRKEDSPRIISVWGVDREAGKRRHEGVDIAAKKRTPVVACAQGTVSSVSINNLGGKVVFMRPSGKNFTLYYAHLDEQLVRNGQKVNEGDVLGLIGNTGNAASTVPHLHFGIYAQGGAVDPLPFIDPVKKVPPAVTADTGIFNAYIRLTRNINLLNGEKRLSGSVAKVEAATKDLYKVWFPDGRSDFVKSSYVSARSLMIYHLKNPAVIYDGPDADAAVKKTVQQGAAVTVFGKHNDWEFVEAEGIRGWIK